MNGCDKLEQLKITENELKIIDELQTYALYPNFETLVKEKLPPHIENQDLYTLTEVSTILSMSIVTIRQYVRTGKLKAIKKWRNWYVSSNEIAKMIYREKIREKCGGRGSIISPFSCRLIY